MSDSFPTPDWQTDNSRLYAGDLRNVLPLLPEATFTACVTDPPYELGFMGKKWDSSGVAFRPETWQAVLRVLKPGAFLLAFGGTRTYHRMTCAIEDAGFEVRDCVFWCYATGFPKSLDISKALDKEAGAEREVVGEGEYESRRPTSRKVKDGGETVDWHYGSGNSITAPATDAAKLWHGWGAALKPAVEPIVVAMKPLDGTFAQNALKHGVAGLNIDGGRIAGTKPLRTAIDSDKRNNPILHTRSATGGNETTDVGRWPANLILDEEAAALLDQQSGFAMTSGEWHGDSGGASSFFYVAKASRAERGKTNNHPTVKPLKLMRYLVQLVMYPQENLILDPFCGSGTTGIAAAKLGCGFVGIEQERPHFDIAVSRIQKALREQREKLFT